jgi:heat-inducible transcriptional repressor
MTGEPVGSRTIAKKYDLGVGSATIRNEMAKLVREGYLDQVHSSAGRVPTTMGLRYFLQEMLKELDDLDVVTKTEVQEQLHASRFDKDALLTEAIHTLSRESHNAAVALVGKQIYYAGLSDMLSIPEFQEIDNLRRIMVILEDYATLSNLFNRNKSDHEVKVLIGEETGLELFSNYAIIFSELRLYGGTKGYIAVIGPNRMDYSHILPLVKFVSSTINKVVGGWN